MQTKIQKLLPALVLALLALLLPPAQAAVIVNVVETGGDNEPTDTITAKWTGQTFPVTVANEPVPGLAIGANYTVGPFGEHAPNYVDRNHRYTNANLSGLTPLGIPAYLVGKEYIMSGNDNRDNASYRLDVTVAQAAQVYLIIDNRLSDGDANTPPTFSLTNMQWVLDEGWTPVNTGNNRFASTAVPDEVGIDEGADGTINQVFSVYTKRFPAGTFALKQADATGRNMYGVVVAAAPSPFRNFAHVGDGATGNFVDNGGGSVTVNGGGNDIWDAQDAFDFNYTYVTGDFDVQARVESLEPVARWTKAGLMVRESLSPTARFGFMRVTPADVATGNGGNGANDRNFAYRTGLPDVGGPNGGQHEDGSVTADYPNAWIRLQRAGSILTTYTSADGVTWDQRAQQDTAGWENGALPAKVLLGFAVGRHSGSDPLATAEFRNLNFNSATLAPLFVESANAPANNPFQFDLVFSRPVQRDSAQTLANYSIPGVTLSSAVLQGDGRTVRIECTSLRASRCNTLTINNVRDTENNLIAANTTAGVVYADGQIRFRLYNGNPGLIGNPNFPNNPNRDEVVSRFENPNGGSGEGDTYGGYINGFLTAPVTGAYRFFLASDDGSELYLSTDDNPANRVLLAREPQWANSREYRGNAGGRRGGCAGAYCENVSGLVNLVGGCRYYIEAGYQEGGGGDHIAVTWVKPGDSITFNGAEPISAQHLSLTTDRLVPVALNPATPANRTVAENEPATLTVTVTAGSPAPSLQWYRNGVAIPGATGTSYTIASASPADNGALFKVVAINAAGRVTSREATLTVGTDTVPPRLVSAAAPTGNFNQFDATFSEAVNAAQAVNLSKYSLPGVTLTGATLVDSKTVRFTCSTLATFGCKVLTVNNISDLATVPNSGSSSIGVLSAAGGALVHRFDGVNGVSVDDLFNNAAYPNSPSVVENVTQMEYSPNLDNYAARIMSFLSPPVTGNYTFYISADDGAALYLSTDENPANKVRIANEPVWAGSRQWTGQASGGGRACPSPLACNISAPINLSVGCRYYFELVYKEGGGGDYGAVAWQTPAGGPQPNVPANGSAPIQGAYLTPFIVPATVFTDIADRTIVCGQSVTFNPVIVGTPPLTLQWYENGVAIPGATGLSYTTRPLTEADSGVKYYLEGVTTTPAGTARTREATITVNPDPTAPVLLSASCNSTFDGVTLVFSKTLDAAAAADTISYFITQVGGGPLGISAAAVLADGKTVVLATTPQSPNTLYRVTVNGNLFDFCGTPIVETNVVIRSFVIACGQLVMETYPTGGGTAVSVLTGHPTFPNNPDSRFNLNSFDTRAELGTDNFRDNYGARIRGFYFPPVSGNYVFYVHSDDASQLFLNPTGTSAAGKVLIAQETGCCRDWPAVSSAGLFPTGIPLVANQPYYIEGLFKEGGGGDYMRVAARILGSTEPLVAIGSNQLGRVSPAGSLGTVSITQQPANRTAQMGDLASFTVAANIGNALSACYQWRRDGVDLPGATGPTLSIGPVSSSDNGAVFSCVISIAGGSATSQNATLTVVPRTGNLSCGFLVFEAYECGGGTAVSRLTSSPLFPGSPRETLYMTAFDTRTVYPNDSHENYGARIRGYFIPPTSGNWIFYLRSDDASQLFLSPSMDPGAKVMLTEEPGCCAGFGAHASSAIPLVAGQPYYIEALYKEGGGGDYCQVAAKLESDPTLPDSLRPIPGAWLAAVVDPTGASLAISTQPQSTKVCLSLGGNNPESLVNETFNSGDGGGTVSNIGAPFEGPWTYNGTRGTWGSAGQGPELGRAPSTRLTFGPYAVTRSGNLRLSFEHRYSFEGDFWDGGQVRVSINGGPFVPVPAAAFTSGGYNGSVTSSSAAELTGQQAFVLDSPGYGAQQFIASVADLGVFLAGDVIRVQFLASFDTNTRQGNPAWEVTSLSLTEGIGGAAVASFSVGVTATGPGGSPNPPVSVQWQRNCGSGWANVPGATASTYTFSPRLADNGCRYRASVCIPGGATTTTEATLAVVQPNTPPSFVRPADFQSYEDAATVVSGFLSNLQPDSIDATEGSFVADFSGVPTPIIFSGSSFDSLPPGAAMVGSAYIGGGRLHLTDAQNSSFGALLTGVDPNPRDAYTVTWKEYVGGGTCCGGNGADGYSLNIASDLQLSGFTAEEGTGSGVSLLFDTWDNGGGEAPAISLKWQGAVVANAPIDVSQDAAAPVFRPVSFSVNAAGQATLVYNGNTVFNNVSLPGWAAQSNLRILLAARTGGANDNHHIDDLALTGLAPVLNVPPPPPARSAVYGSAYLGDGVLHLTDAINGASGAFVVDDLLGGAPLGRFSMNFTARIGGGTAPPADGFAVSIAANLPAGTWAIAEEGEGNGLSVCFDIFDNGGGEAPAIDVKWQGTTIAHTSVPSLETGNAFVPVSIRLDPDGTLDLTVNGTAIHTDLPTGYVPISGAKFGMGGRTGGLNANQWIDDLNIQATAVNAGDAEASQTITFQVSNDNPTLFSVQPAISGDGTLTYTPAPNACGSARLTIVARDNGGTDPQCGGRDTADPVQVNLTIVGVNDCPVAAPVTVSVAEGGSAPVVLAGTDVDANGCGLPISGFVILTPPAHGTLSGTPPNLIYTPAADFPNVCGHNNAADSFTYAATDGQCTSSPATVNITVVEVNDCPVARIANSLACQLGNVPQGQTFIISPNGTNAVVIIDGRQSSDVECDPITYAWYLDGSVVPFSTLSHTTNVFALGQHSVQLVVDDGVCVGMSTLVLEVISPGDAVDLVIQEINNSTLERREQRPLVASLKVAIASYERESPISGNNQLSAFLNKVRAQVAPENPALAARLTAQVQSIISAVQCSEAIQSNHGQSKR